MTKERLDRVTQVLSLRQPDLTVIMDGVHKPHNIAAIVRSCDAVGVMEVHLAKPLGGFVTPHATSGGSQKWVKQLHYENAMEPIRLLQARNFQVIAANKSDNATDYRSVDFTRPTAILMGAELLGVGQDVLPFVDKEVYIPMVGMVESFNVSVACAILLAEAQRQRLTSGHYDSAKLMPEEINRMRFEWMYPKLAKLYQKQQKVYPLLDHDGDIVTDRTVAEMNASSVV